MTPAARRKRRLFYASMIALAAWPLVHLGLVLGWGLSPWKLAGWGMYAAPRLSPGMRIAARRRDEREPFELSEPSPALRAQGEAFLRRRRWLGELADPGDLGAAILRARPDLEEIAIVLYVPRLRTEDGLLDLETRRFDYRATDPPPDVPPKERSLDSTKDAPRDSTGDR